MRILYLTLKASGAHFQKWAEAAIARGHTIQILHSMKDTPVLDVPTHFVDADSTLLARTIGRLRHAAECRRIIRRFEPDLVHVHFMDPNLTVLGWQHFPRTIVSIWGSDLINPRMWLNEMLRRRGLRGACRVTATNRLLAYACHAHLPMDRKVEIIPFGVDTALFSPAPRFPDGRFVVGCVKHFETVYGLEYLVRAVAQVRSRIPGIELVLAGSGRLRGEIEKLVQQLGIADITRFPGPIANHDVPALLHGLDVFAMPSLYESFGVSALEASACGLPVISSDSGGIPDVVQHGQTGLLVPPGDSPALAESLLTLYNDPVLRNTLGKQGREFVQSRFEWNDCADRMERLYQSVAGSARASAAPAGLRH